MRGNATDCFEASWATLRSLHGQGPLRAEPATPQRVVLCSASLGVTEVDDLVQSWRSVVHPARLLLTVSPGQPDRPLVRQVLQPTERGTAPAILLAILPELVDDPEAVFVIVTDPRDRPETLEQLGGAYLEAANRDSVVRVRRAGVGVVVGSGAALLRVYAQTVPGLLRLLTYYIEMPEGERPAFLERAYAALPTVDFRTEVLGPAIAAGLAGEAAETARLGVCRTRSMRHRRPGQRLATGTWH